MIYAVICIIFELFMYITFFGSSCLYLEGIDHETSLVFVPKKGNGGGARNAKLKSEIDEA